MNTLEVHARLEEYPEESAQFAVIDVLVDGQQLDKLDDRGISVINWFDLARSTKEDGELFMLTCACGDPGCAGWMQGFQVRRDEENVYWKVPLFGDTREFVFRRDTYENAIRRGIEDFGALLAEHAKAIASPDYPVSWQEALYRYDK